MMGKNRKLAESILGRLELISNANRKVKDLGELWIESVEQQLDEFEAEIRSKFDGGVSVKQNMGDVTGTVTGLLIKGR